MPRVLIVDDDTDPCRAVLAELACSGFEVVIATSTGDALNALAKAPFDIAMIDLMMPGLNGLALARKIRRAFPAVRVVLSSAYHLSARQVERADCGAVGFVPKPYRTAELCSFLRAKTEPVTPAAL